jgi:hypothetical protein
MVAITAPAECPASTGEDSPASATDRWIASAMGSRS